MSQKLNIELTETQLEALDIALLSGEYSDSQEIVAEALQEWVAKRTDAMAENLRVRALWDEGLASGQPRPADFNSLRQEARRRLQDAARNDR